MDDPVRLTIQIKNKNEIELLDLTRSLFALADEFKRHITKLDDPVVASDIRLYVKEIRSGSIITDLVALAPCALPLIENSNTIIGFTVYLKSVIDYFLGNSAEKPHLEKANYENISQILDPIAKDNGSQFNASTINNTFNGPVVINIGSMEANAAQNAIRKELAALAEPITGNHEKVVLYWYQARNDPKSKSGDKAIIESIYGGPVKTIFVSDWIKSKILSSSENPFTTPYIVDVAVETVSGRPVLYRIIEVYEQIEN